MARAGQLRLPRLRRLSRRHRRLVTAATLGAVLATGLTLPAGASPSASPIVGAAASPNGGGWEVTADGSITTFGGAPSFGSLAGRPLNRPVVGMAATPDGGGYWLVASDGGIFSFGDAAFRGSTGNVRLNRPVVGMAATPDGGGYWLVASDGGIFSFGDAAFRGSTGNIRLNRPVVGMAASPDGAGYWLVASDGGVFTFGDAPFVGSLGATPGLTIAAMAPAAAGRGYWLAQSNGTATPFPGNLAAGVPAPPAPTPTTTPPPAPVPVTAPVQATAATLGVLEADPTLMAQDQQAGVRLATLNLSWAEWEPQNGVFNPGYRSAVVAKANAYRAAGWKVAVDLGLQQPPAWVLALPGGRLVDQNGRQAPGADFEFSQAVRDAAAPFMVDVVQSMGPIDDYRVGLSQNGEAYYPDVSNNGWWAFTPQAQGLAAGLPNGVAVDPMPGWVPGTRTWNGMPVTQTQVTAWYDWYFGALVNAHAWEIATYRSAGYAGQLELVMPGMGSLPAFYQQRLADDLAPGGEDSFSTLNSGAVWWRMLNDLGPAALTNTAIDISSVYDNSGNPRGNACQAADDSVNPSDSQIWGWSDTRWLAYLARSHNLPVMGENPGNTPASDLPGVMHLVASCHLTALQWAWDYTLDRPGNPTRSQLATAAANAS